MSNPVINLSEVYNIFFNVQSLAVLNPDGTSWTMEKAIMRVVDTNAEDDIGDKTYGQRTKCNFLFFRTIMPDGISPQINSKITDNNGTNWYVGQIENMYFGNVLKLHCESQAGIGVQDEQFPVATTSTSTSSTTGEPSGCQNNDYESNGVTLVSQLRACCQVDDPLFHWFVENTPLDANQISAVQFEITDISNGNLFDIVLDAQALTGGAAYIKLNNVNISGNVAGTIYSDTFGVTLGDIILIYFQSPTTQIYGALNAGINLIGVATSTSSSSSSSSSTSTSSTSTSSTSTSSTTVAPFVPTDISGCQLWFDWSDTSTLFQDTAGLVPISADGQDIQRINDKSGNNRFSNQKAENTWPVYEANYQNGLSVGSMQGLNWNDGRRTVMFQNNCPLTDNFTHIYVTTVANAGPNNGGNTSITLYDSQGQAGVIQNPQHGQRVEFQPAAGGVVNITGSGLPNNRSGFGIFMYDYDLNTTTANVYGNSITPLGTNTSVSSIRGSANTWRIFWNGNGDGSMFIAEAIFYNKVLNNTERAQVRNYLQAKWGI